MTDLKSKSSLRNQFRKRCSQVSAVDRVAAGLSAAKHLVSLPVFKDSKRIACYLSSKHEFDSSPIIEAIWQAKKKCYLPIVTAENEKSLHFERYEYGDALHLNRYAILEPVNTNRQIPPENLDMVIVPLIAFDAYGHRLGSGGGYYDRTFSFLQSDLSQKPRMIGLAYRIQQLDLLPSDPWDIVLNGVLTEDEFMACQPSRGAL